MMAYYKMQFEFISQYKESHCNISYKMIQNVSSCDSLYTDAISMNINV